MNTKKCTKAASLSALFLALSATAVRADSQGGYYLSHQQACAAGGVGNYAPEHGLSGQADIVEPNDLRSDETGRFVSHDQAVLMGGVGNYVTEGEAHRYDKMLADQDSLRNQVASNTPVQPVAEASKDEGVVFFDNDSAILNEDGRREIAMLADELNKNSGLIVEVNGYADGTGSSTINQQLSADRSRAVKNELLARGVTLDQIHTYAFGSDEPIAANDTTAGRAVNRRAELYIEDANEMAG